MIDGGHNGDHYNKEMEREIKGSGGGVGKVLFICDRQWLIMVETCFSPEE